MEPAELTYTMDRRSERARYVLEFVLRTIGFVPRQTDDGDADVHYVSQAGRAGNGVTVRRDPSHVVWKALLRGDVDASQTDGVIPFDVISAIGFFLSDEGNRAVPADAHDVHHRLPLRKSVQYRAGLADVPLVNRYVRFVGSVVESRLGVRGLPLWPDGKRCAVGLSHDVDAPDKYAILSAPAKAPNADLRDNLKMAMKRGRMWLKRLRDRTPDDFWLFERVMDLEERYGFRSTFFFAAANQFSPWGRTPYDVEYDVRRRAFREVFGQLGRRGFEIGLHASYEAYRDPARFVAERERLAEMSGAVVTGLRHHYWHLGPDVDRTLRMHERTGFEYDSSVAFNEELGFRRSVALGYRPWSAPDGRAIRVWQLPVICMDGNLFYRPIEHHVAVARLRQHVGAARDTGGLGVIDWHVRTAYPANAEYRSWGEAYVALIEWLAQDPGIWVTSLGEIASWLSRREARLRAERPSA